MNFLFFFFTLIVIKFEADALEIECRYSFDYTYGPRCIVESFKSSSSDDCEVTSVTWTQASETVNNDNIKYFDSSKPFDCFPKNLENFFKNLDKIHFSSPNFTILKSDDLQPFGSQLKMFWFYNSKLEVITADLFDHTTNLEFLYLGSNKITHVQQGAFSKLTKLTELYFGYNPCHSGIAYERAVYDRAAVLNLIVKIEIKCTNEGAFTRYMNQFIPAVTTTTTTTTTTERNFPDELSTCNKVNEDHVAELEKYKADLKAEKDKVTNIENQVVAKDAKIEELQQELAKKSSIVDIKELLMKLETKIDKNYDTTNAKLDSTAEKLTAMDSKYDATKDLITEDFTSINATCSSFDHKLEVMNANWLSRCCRKP